MTPDISRKPPGSEEADFAVLSCMMQSPNQAIPIAADMLRASDFATMHAAYMFELILMRHGGGHPVDPASLMVALDDPNKVQMAGGAAKLLEAFTAAELPTAVKSYCETVKDASTLRTVARLAGQIETVAYAKPDDWRQQAQQMMGQIDNAMTDVNTTKSISHYDVIMEYTERCIDDCEGELDPAVTTGIKALDELMDGGTRREFILIGGKQGGGKTLLGMQMAGHLANAGRRGLVIGLEMSPLQLVMRDIAREAQVPLPVVTGRNRDRKTGHIDDMRKTVIRTAQTWDVHYSLDSYITIEGIASLARSLHRVKPLDFILLDYIQLVTRAGNGKERSDEILKTIAEKLQALRRSLGCTLIVPTQLNDEGEVRDSRALQDAPETVLKIVMDARPNDADKDDPDLGIIKITKARWGRVGSSCRVERNGMYQRFQDSDEPMSKPKKEGFTGGKRKW
jgi:replicative DNA helicase